MILSDGEIRAAIARGALRITPEPPAEAWSSTAVDLRLSPILRRWRLPPGSEPGLEFRPADPDFDFQALNQQFAESVHIPAEGYALRPGGFVLGWTVETISLPHRSRLAARVEGKSSLARLGLGVHVTAPTIHAGFGARTDDPAHPGTTLQLEIWHVGPLPIRLTPNMPICQLIFETVRGTPEKGYAGIFAVQGGG